MLDSFLYNMMLGSKAPTMMPGSKGLNPHELAHKWMKDLGIRPNMSLKVG